MPDKNQIRFFNLLEKFQRRWFAKSEEETALLNGFFAVLSEKLTANEMSTIDDARIRSFVDLVLNKGITLEQIRIMSYDEIVDLLIVEEGDQE